MVVEDNVALGESADWHSIHTPCCKTKDEFRTGKPCLLQEAWVPTPSTRKGEKDLEDHLSKKPGLDAEIRRLRIDALELEYEHGQLAL